MNIHGRLLPDAPLAPVTWLRAGGSADILFIPADEADLQAYLAALASDIPVTVIGVGSNLLVRDGGVRGVTIRLGRAFGKIELLSDLRLRVGAFARVAHIAEKAAEAGVGGFEFLRGIPGTLGGALAMNAGCYGYEIARLLESVTGMDRNGRRVCLHPAEMAFCYRECGAARERILVEAVLAGRAAPETEIRARMQKFLSCREASQPLRERTGGSLFRNPSGRSSTPEEENLSGMTAWQLIEAAGCRGLRRGEAEISCRHANFLINRGGATAADLEFLGQEVRARVYNMFGTDLIWEIRRIGEPAGKENG